MPQNSDSVAILIVWFRNPDGVASCLAALDNATLFLRFDICICENGEPLASTLSSEISSVSHALVSRLTARIRCLSRRQLPRRRSFVGKLCDLATPVHW